jgi:hypothetical protein
MHQVGPNEAGRLSFSFLAFKGEAVGVTQISSYNGNGNGAWQTEKKSLKSCYSVLKIPKKWK